LYANNGIRSDRNETSDKILNKTLEPGKATCRRLIC